MTSEKICRIPTILKEIEPHTKQMMSSCGVLKRYKKDELIFRDKEEVDRFYFVICGQTALYKLNRLHDKKVIFVYGRGEMLNEVLVTEPKSSINCEALSDVTVLSFSREEFLEMMSLDFKLAKAVMDSLAKKTRRLYHQLGNTSGTTRLDRRVASKLWKLARDFGRQIEKGRQITFDLSITYLADMVGSRRETVSRAVRTLTDSGLVCVENNKFIILNMEQLKAYCGK